MIPGILHLAFRSVKFNLKTVIYQVLITGLLSAVITGSLLTGYSVRKSLKASGEERLGNTAILISSGARFFNRDVAEKFRTDLNINSTAVLETAGYSQNLSSQKSALNSSIWFTESNFFAFHGNRNIQLSKGEVAVNEKLASELELKPGDEIIIRYKKISNIPADSPFAPEKDGETSVVMKVGIILTSEENGNFSLSISQITPKNIFVSLSDLSDFKGAENHVNRLLVDRSGDYSKDEIFAKLKQILSPEDIGLTIRSIPATGGSEIISDRVFVDELVLNQTFNALPDAAPVLTYLANRFTAGDKITPYSFIAGLPSSVYPNAIAESGIIINKWLADDLNVSAGDSLKVFWYSPDSLNTLVERNTVFVINKIAGNSGIWSDSLLMPEFPGIAGSESCSDWDAGVAIKTDQIRDKDEEYWNYFRGTPKAFLSYETAVKLWGNNFGPATSIRFPVNIKAEDIRMCLTGNLDPGRSGFTVRDISGETLKAASESVDFGTLFLSLGFFLIVAALVLLSFITASYFDSKKNQISTLFAIGFPNRLIRKVLLTESIIVTLAGSVAGAAAGLAVSLILTNALNGVWRGAVQTDTLLTYYGFYPLMIGLLSTFFIVMLLMFSRTNRYLRKLDKRRREQISKIVPGRSRIYLLVSIGISLLLFGASLYYTSYESGLSFAAGSSVMITFLIFWRHYFLTSGKGHASLRSNSERYYALSPSHGITPILFIAAGIFAVFITEGNRMSFDEKKLNRNGGTGGYLIWAETRLPVSEDLNTNTGRKSAGLDDNIFDSITIVQAKRSAGDDASCLNLNHVTAPPLLGIEPSIFTERGSFSFATVISGDKDKGAWDYVNRPSENGIIYGVADQTVLQWGLMIKTGDTLILRSETGQPLKIIIAGGLQTSVFQGHILISRSNFIKFYPSISGNSVFLIDGDNKHTDNYLSTLSQIFEGYGVEVQTTTDRLASFYAVTNTYLSVFSFLGLLGMVIGIAGLGFVLLRNYNRRKKEFALLLAVGITVVKIKRMIFSEQLLILIAGISAGVISALIATLPSIRENPAIPWGYLFAMIAAIFVTGILSLLLSMRQISGETLIKSLRSE